MSSVLDVVYLQIHSLDCTRLSAAAIEICHSQFTETRILPQETIDLKNINSSSSSITCLESGQYQLPIGIFFVATIFVVFFAWSQHALSIVLVYAALLVTGILLLIALIRKSNRHRASALFISVFSYNVILAILFYLALESMHGVPYLFGGSDDQYVDVGSQTLARSIAWYEYSKVPEIAPPSKFYGYFFTVTLLHKVGNAFGGTHTLVPTLFNGFVGAWIPVVLYLLAIDCRYSPRTAKWAAYAAGFYPLMAFHAALMLRDTIVGFLTIFIVYGVIQIRFIRRRIWMFALLVAIAGLMLWEFRDMSVAALSGVIFAATVYSWVPRIRQGQRWFAVLFVVAITIACLGGGMLLLLSTDARMGYDIQTITGRYESSRQDRAAADSVGLLLLQLPVPVNYLARIAYASIDPLPELTSNFPRLWKSIGALLWYSLLPFFFIGLPAQFRDVRKSYLAIVSIGLFFGVALTSLHDRHAVHYAPVFILFGIDGFQRYRRYRSSIFLLAAYIFTWMIWLYIVVKFVYLN